MTRASDQPTIAVGDVGWEHIIHVRISRKGSRNLNLHFAMRRVAQYDVFDGHILACLPQNSCLQQNLLKTVCEEDSQAICHGLGRFQIGNMARIRDDRQVGTRDTRRNCARVGRRRFTV